jgi:hypothetical protein
MRTGTYAPKDETENQIAASEAILADEGDPAQPARSNEKSG